MDLSILFAGTAGSAPSARRGLPAFLIRRGGERILIDCGEGTQRQLVRSVGLPDITDVFITHFHVDHWLGLPGMLKSFDLRDRERPLTVHGPPGLRDLMASIKHVYGRLGFGLEIRELEASEAVRVADDCSMHAFAVEHRGTAYGYALVEDPRPGRFDAGLARELGVTPGPDFGRLERGETVDGVRPEQVIGPAREARKVVFSGDTRAPCATLAVVAHRADLLIHEATFAAQERDRAQQTGHSTALAAAELARDAEVRMLALTHISARYAGPELRDEARSVFEQAYVPRDFDTVDIPLPDRGAPQLIRHSGGAPPAGATVS